jgi:hypothetical protein
MRDSLVRLDQYLIESRTELLAKIFFIPFGMEDEGVILANWLKEKNGKNTYIATLHRPMDCFDLLVGGCNELKNKRF